MEDFRRQFLIESAGNLRALAESFQSAPIVSDSVKREAFRTLHTVKGTAQTFGFNSASRLAHELETLLSVTKNEKNFKFSQANSLLLEGIELLIESLERKNFKIPASFTEKVHGLVPATRSVSENFSSNIPAALLSQLTVQEKNAVRSALETDEMNLFCFEVGYDTANFAGALINFREILDKSGEIIATLPGVKFNGGGKIGFRILYASAVEMPKIRAIAEASAAAIIFNSSPNVFSGDAAGVLAQVAEHGRVTAEKLGKQIEFKVTAVETLLPPDTLKTIFDIALHLVRNAVDHAVETNGKIEISLKGEKTGWLLIVSDDGRGIDLEKIKAKAVQEKLIADAPLTERETIDLIFLPEFSTKTTVSEISGRGIGLDAVKSAIEKRGGKINVQSRSGKGTTFEIFLP